MVARRDGSSSSMREITQRVSRGSSRSRRKGPLIEPAEALGEEGDGVAASRGLWWSAAAWVPLAGAGDVVSTAGVLLGLRRDLSYSGSGGEMKSRNELSDGRGAFQGKRRSDMQQKMMAMDQMSAALAS